MKTKVNFTEAYFYLISYTSLTYIFIVLNINGYHQDSLSISLFQTLVSFITLGFSADFRSLYFTDKIYANLLIRFRAIVIFMLLIGIIFYFFKAPDSTTKSLILWLSLKRIIDWIDEVIIISSNVFLLDSLFKYKYLISQVFFIALLPLIYLKTSAYIHYYFLAWIAANFLLLKKYYVNFHFDNLRNQLLGFTFTNQKYFFALQLISTLFINLSNIAFRSIIAISFVPQKSSMIISSFAFGGMFFSVTNNSILPYLVQENKEFAYISPYLKKYLSLILVTLLFVAFLLWFFNDILISLNISYEVALLSFLSSGILFFSSFLRYSIIQLYKNLTLSEDFFSQTSFMCILIFFSIHGPEYLIYSTIYLALICLLVFSLKYNALSKGKWTTLIYLIIEIFLLFLTAYLAIKAIG